MSAVVIMPPKKAENLTMGCHLRLLKLQDKFRELEARVSRTEGDRLLTATRYQARIQQLEQDVANLRLQLGEARRNCLLGSQQSDLQSRMTNSARSIIPESAQICNAPLTLHSESASQSRRRRRVALRQKMAAVRATNESSNSSDSSGNICIHGLFTEEESS